MSHLSINRRHLLRTIGHVLLCYAQLSLQTLDFRYQPPCAVLQIGILLGVFRCNNFVAVTSS